MTVLLVGAGGLVGAMTRYLLGAWVQDVISNHSFPYGTLTVNVVGCLLIGLIAGLVETRDALTVQTRAFLTVGVLGGFTTYSAFGFETVILLRDGDLVAGITNVSLQIVLGLTAVWLGLRVSQLV